MLKTPVVISIFNRPEETARVFAEVARARPCKLFVIADGARPERSGEAELVARTRAVTERIDWDCDVVRIYSDVNLNNRVRFATGYTEVFKQVEEAILLEDDCLPHPTFFRFCEELLERYRDDQRIWTISGTNFLFGKRVTTDSYCYSRYHLLWGFATWRRVWNHYDADLKLWPSLRDTPWLLDTIGNVWGVKFWAQVFDELCAGTRHTWDSQYAFAAWANNALACSPARNLICNIGFGPNAMGMTDRSNPTCELPTFPMEFPLVHPPTMIRHAEGDQIIFDNIFAPVVVPKKRGLCRRLAGRLKRLVV